MLQAELDAPEGEDMWNMEALVALEIVGGGKQPTRGETCHTHACSRWVVCATSNAYIVSKLIKHGSFQFNGPYLQSRTC